MNYFLTKTNLFMEYEYSYESDFSIPGWAIALICVLALIQLIAMWKVFVKAGQPGWACIIPIYNIYVMTKIAGKPGIWVLWCLIPIVNLIFIIWLYNMISKSFGHDEGFTVGLILLGVIFWPILGFGSSKYQGPYGNPELFRSYQEQHRFEFEKKPPQT
jgi:hypothetical protein